eukprot:COSAG05_NODE_1853_length_3957_cov_1.878434_2_plen_84_part_00
MVTRRLPALEPSIGRSALEAAYGGECCCAIGTELVFRLLVRACCVCVRGGRHTYIYIYANHQFEQEQPNDQQQDDQVTELTNA